MRVEHRRGRHPWTVALAVLLALICAACAHKPPVATPVIVAPPQPAQTDPAIALLEYASQLSRGTPEQREQAVAAARRAVSNAPGAMHYAQLALAYGAPAQRRYTPDEVARYAQLALQADDAHWTQAARQYLHDYARLYAALNRQRPVAAAPARATRTQSDGEDKRRIAELQSQLTAARRKLRELADIEGNLSADTP